MSAELNGGCAQASVRTTRFIELRVVNSSVHRTVTRKAGGQNGKMSIAPISSWQRLLSCARLRLAEPQRLQPS
jgi:hypothetical protein